MLRAALLSFLLILVQYAGCELVALGPRFTLEPAARVRYGAGAGARLRCAAVGDPPPALAWLAQDNTELRDAPGIRRVYGNGTLEVLPSTSYHVAAATVRCRASNAHGTALSRDVVLQPVADVNWETVLVVSAAAAGGVAALACRASPPAAPAAPALWYRGDHVINLNAPRPDSRYIVAGDTLLIRDVSVADAGPYSCLARHALTALTKRSRPAHLSVTTATASSAPRLAAPPPELAVAAGDHFCLPCVASDHPPPHYTWYREWNGRLQPVEADAGGGGGGGAGPWLWGGGAALCGRAAAALAGAWLCKAYNVFGDATLQLRLDVADTLTVTVTPNVVIADTGSTVRLNCSASVRGAALSWVHEAAAAGAGAVLLLRDVTRAARGVYQCFARTPTQHAQATAEIRLGDSAPELHYTFIEQALRPGGAVSLRCAASGAPQPLLSWLLDEQPLDQYRTQHRYFISSETSSRGDVVSTLNITAAAAPDGGRYSCRASNHLGHAEHSARLNIYGPPSIRAVGPVRVVAGANATIYCPYAGYPISSVSWRRRGAAGAAGGGAVGSAGRVAARGAALRLAPALPADAGHYSCAVSAPEGPQARRDIEIQVRNPPKISPFMFSSELTEGSSVQVLCGVSSGDKPMYFSWMKDGAPLPTNLQIEEKSLNEFSLLMFSDLSARHSGEYTCRVSNHAATVNYTATLSVKVAPAWVTEPLDAAVLLGAPIHLECAAKGYPTPTVTWYRKFDEGSLSPENEQWEQLGGAWGSGAGVGSGVLVREGESGVRERDGALTAPAAARRHQGVYRCTADNGVGPPLIKHVNLTVHEPAHFESSAGNMSCVRGHSASLSCHARGDAPLAVIWSHQGIKLDLNSYRWTVSEVRTGEGLRSTLQLRAAERADAGEYRCHAHNQYGRSELLMYLHVEEPPQAPRSVRLSGVGSRWIRVEWQASPPTVGALRSAGGGGYLGGGSEERYSALCNALHSLPGSEPPNLTFNLTLDIKGDASVGADGLQTLSSKIEGLRPAAAYSLRLVAGNHVGQSPHSEPLMFTTLEEAPSAPPQNVRVRPAGPGELHVSWSAPVQDSWNGELLGYAATWRSVGRFADSEAETEAEAEEARGRLTAPGWSSTELTLAGLRGAARYAVALRAYNRAGAGPASPVVYATTADGVPESPPKSVTCEALSSQSLRVRWSPPPASAHALRGYDVHYAPLQTSSPWRAPAEAARARDAAPPEVTLEGLAAGTNYSVWVRARADAGLGPPSSPVYCTTREDVPGAVTSLRALASGVDAVRVSWLAPHAAGLSHYTLYTKELGKSGGEWSQRVEAGEAPGLREDREEQEEVWREVRGLRGAVYSVWVVAESRAGRGPPSHVVTAAPAVPVSARISSFGRSVTSRAGRRVRLPCGAVGAPPLRWRWTPLPPAHTVTDTGDLIIHKMERALAGNYTCSVRNAGGADAATYSLRVRATPGAPAPRLARAEPHALHLAWDPPDDGGAPILGYTVRWSRWEATEALDADAVRVWAGAEGAVSLRRLACGARYRIALTAHNALGTSPHSAPLSARTKGDKAVPAPGKEFVWANSSALRLNLLAWRTRCAVRAWRVALRPLAGPGHAASAPAPWGPLPTDGESAEMTGLRPGTWYEIRVVASSPAGETVALYRAATHTLRGEQIGEAMEVSVEARNSRGDVAGLSPDGAGGGVVGAGGGGSWRAGLAPAAAAAALAALLAALAGTVGVRRGRGRAAWCVRRECAVPRACAPHPHPQLYTTEPGKRNGKVLTPPDGDLNEISPYATFSMSGGGEGAGACAGSGVPGGGGAAGGAGAGGAGCALHLRTFGRAEALDLAAPPPRPNLLTHPEWGRARGDSDSESSGSGCAACAHDLYRQPALRPDHAMGAVESSAEETSYSAGGRGGARGERTPRHAPAAARGKRRRDQPPPTVRYFSPASMHGSLHARQEAL